MNGVMVKREREGWNGRLGRRFDQEPGRKELRAELFFCGRGDDRVGGKQEWLRENKSAWKQSFNRSRKSEGKKQPAVIFHCKDQGSDSRDVNKHTLPCTARTVHASAGSCNYRNVCLRVCVLFASFSLLLARKKNLCFE